MKAFQSAYRSVAAKICQTTTGGAVISMVCSMVLMVSPVRVQRSERRDRDVAVPALVELGAPGRTINARFSQLDVVGITRGPVCSLKHLDPRDTVVAELVETGRSRWSTTRLRSEGS